MNLLERLSDFMFKAGMSRAEGLESVLRRAFSGRAEHRCY